MTLTIADIQAAVADHYGIAVAELRGRDRRFGSSHPRMVAMYLSRRNLARSYTDIARAFGRHHTTIIHGERRVLSAPELMADALEISARLSNLVSWRERAKQQIEIHGFGNPARSNPCAGGAPAAVRPQPPMPPGRSFGAAP